MLPIPIDSLPENWIKTVLGGDAPDEAFKQIGISTEDGMDYEKMKLSIEKWKKMYAGSSLVSIPAIRLKITFEVKGIPGVPKSENFGWSPTGGVLIAIPPTCL